MFDNIGEKIKVVAKVLFVLGIIGFFIASMCMFGAAGETYDEEATFFTTLGIVYLFAGPVISWLSSIFIYGFGELITKTSNLEKHFCGSDETDEDDTDEDENN